MRPTREVIGDAREWMLWSDTRAPLFVVRRMLEDLMLPWANLGPTEWMCAIPRATAKAIFALASQSSGVQWLSLLVLPVVERNGVILGRRKNNGILLFILFC